MRSTNLSWIGLDLDLNRIIVAEEDLMDPHKLEVNVNQGLAWPYGLHLDQQRGRLYVTEWNQGRILRLDLP